MNIEEIKSRWLQKESNENDNINLWNEKADYFGNYEIPKIEEDEFLSLLKRENVLNEKFKVLDVGCGGGKYSLSLSKECEEVLGIDLSPKMIEYANINKMKFNIDNVSFLCNNWHDMDIKEANLYKKFDLVFASMTPAIGSAVTFEKLIDASKKYCVLRCGLNRSDFIYDKLREELNIENNKDNLNFLYALNMIYLKGYLPRVFYEEKTWAYEETLEKSYNVYTKKIKSIKSIEKKEEEKIKKLLYKMSKDGCVKEEIKSTIATIIFEVN